MKEESQLHNLINFINENERVLRKDLVASGFPMKLTDTYRRMLTVVGFLEATSRGEYKRLRMVPWLKTTELKRRYFRELKRLRREQSKS